MGSLCVLLSEHLVSGLVTGTAILVLASQLKYVFGVKINKHSGPQQLIYVSWDKKAFFLYNILMKSNAWLVTEKKILRGFDLDY